MEDKSLRVKLVIVSFLGHNLNQQISHFCSFNSTRKVRSDKNFGSSTFKPDTVSAVSAQLCPPPNAYRGPPNGDL